MAGSRVNSMADGADPQLNEIETPENFDPFKFEPSLPAPVGEGWVLATHLNGQRYWTPQSGGPGGGGVWGGIIGDITQQSDLESALGAKQSLNTNLTNIAGLPGTTAFGRSFLNLSPTNSTILTVNSSGNVSMRTLVAGDIPSLDASKISSGVVAQARLGSGSDGSGAHFLADDQTYKSIAGAGFGSQSANQFFAGPTSGSAAVPTFRGLVAADVPDLSGSYVPVGRTVNGHALSSNVTVSASDVGLGNVANELQTKASIVPNAAPSAGQILIGNGIGTAYSPLTLSGSGATLALSSAGVLTISAVLNATLQNSAITIAGTLTSLGGSITQDTITGLSSVGLVKRTGSNTLATAMSGTDYELPLSFSSPITRSTNTISMPAATSSVDGYLGHLDWVTFNAKQSALSFGNLTEATSSVLTIVGGTGSIIGSGLTIQVKAAGSSQAGYLSSSDWTTFNSKLSTSRLINTSSPLSGGGDLTSDRTLSIANAAADSSTKGAATFASGDFNDNGSGLISLDYANGQKATGSQAGFLSSTDWTGFNGKLSSLPQDKMLFVDDTSGNDGTALRGRTDRPFKTLAVAVASASAGDEIYVLSNLSYSGAVTLSVQLTLDFHGHKITCATQTDTAKISVAAVGCVVRNVEIDGVWDHSTSGTTTGPAINGFFPSTRWENIYVHDIMDDAFAFNGDWSYGVFKNLRSDWSKQSGFSANSQNSLIRGPSEFGPITVTNTVLGKGIAIARGGAETNPVYGVNIHDIYYDNISLTVPAEGMYIHGLTDFHISHVRGSRSSYNLSCDACVSGAIDNVVIHGGPSVVYSGIELAGCYRIAISNSILDGTSQVNGTATITIASPGVVTWTAHGLTNGECVKFSSTGALPTGVVPGRVYYLINVATNTFQLSSTSGGTAINTTGSQSGTHTAYWTSPAETNNAGIQSSNLSALPLFGEFTFTNVSTFNWANGFNSQPGNGITIVGGYWSGYQGGISLDGVEHFQVTGAKIECVEPYSGTPLSIRAGGATYSDFLIVGNRFNASSSADAIIALYSAFNSSSVLDQIVIVGNKKLDSNFHASGTIKGLTGSGGTITNLRVEGNYPTDYSDGTGWANIPSVAKLGVRTDTPSADIDVVSSYHGTAKIAARSDQDSLYGIQIRADYSNSSAWGIQSLGSSPVDVLYGPQDGTKVNAVPISFKHLADSSAPNDTVYYSTTLSDIAYRDSGGTSHALSGGAGLTVGTSAITSGTGGRVLYETSGNVLGEISGATSDGTTLTLIAPILGTPASGALTSCTGLPLTTGVTGTLPVANGGTNITSYAVGDLIYASGSTTLSKLADVAVGSYLRSGGVTTAPVWSTTTLPNSATTGDLLYASASNVYSNLADVATGNALISGGTSTAPSWGKITTSHTTGIAASGANTDITSISGSAASLSVSGQTGLLTVTGLTSTNRAKTVRDAADTLLELGGSYTPTGTWTSLPLTNPKITTAIQDANGNSMLAFTATASSIFGFTLTNAASGGTVALGVTAPTQAASGIAGTPLSLTASNAVAGSSNAGAVAGGAVTITSGNAARLTSGNANGGNISLVTGTGIGTGTAGQVIVPNGTTSAPSIAFTGATTTGITLNSGVALVQGGTELFRADSGSIVYSFATDTKLYSTNGRLILGNTDNLGIAKNAAGVMEINNYTMGQWGALKLGVRDSGTTTVTNGLTIGHQLSSGTAAAGLGSAVLFNIDSSTTADQNAGRIAALWTTATHASRTADLVFYNVNGAAALAETGRITAGGVYNSLTGFQIGSAAASGNYLRGNGTNFVSSAIQASDILGTSAVVRANTRVTAQTAANSSIATYTNGASDASFLVSGNINVSAAIAISTSLNCDYTDETNTARTMIIPISGLGGTFVAGGLATSTGPFESTVMHIRCKASTAITIYTASGTFTSVTYTAEGLIRQIS